MADMEKKQTPKKKAEGQIPDKKAEGVVGGTGQETNWYTPEGFLKNPGRDE